MAVDLRRILTARSRSEAGCEQSGYPTTTVPKGVSTVNRPLEMNPSSAALSIIKPAEHSTHVSENIPADGP
jgi:hypothetical protein